MDRLSVSTPTIGAAKLSDFALLVREGLSKSGQKELPSKYFYDEVGSALFELICLLPEYGLTRAEERILASHAQNIVAGLPQSIAVAELGSGSGKKTRLILEALCHRRTLSYYPIEISPKALAMCERELSDIRSVNIVGLEREYLDGLLEVAARRGEDQTLLVLFLGSTIGNFDGDASIAFLRKLRDVLWKGDYLLLGTDLRKPKQLLLGAYDDALGVTAAFNRNLLVRINRELGGEFVLERFAHQAVFNEKTQSVEMHLRSLTDQKIAVSGASLQAQFAEGETIWTETSHKYSREELGQMAVRAGFIPQAIWTDTAWEFADSLWAAS